MTSTVHILGIRHHGPGSARHLLTALELRQPDILLVEGPADASAMLPWLASPELEPPVALVMYRCDMPKKAAYFPLAVFSPEYQAIRFALQRGVEVRFFDLPQSCMLSADTRPAMPETDPLQRFAEAAGHRYYERWWNELIEQRQGSEDAFEAVLEMMQELRAYEATLPQAEPAPDQKERMASQHEASQHLAAQREAHMRQSIRAAQAEGFRSIAVVCGAYHGPALELSSYSEASDQALLAILEHTEVDAAWVPWSYSRLSTALGYGAGVHSPGWYQHLWDMAEQGASLSDISISWLLKVAALLRQEGFDTSPAHVIETVRLAESLAAMRDMPFPGLAELSEASVTVMCFGDSRPLGLIQKRLIVGERQGAVPSDSPMVPLQRDLHRQQRDLRLRPELDKSTLNLDLRNELHLARSHLLHRLRLLNINWGDALPSRNKGGTFRELWSLQWQPEYAIRVIEANIWGNTVDEAASSYAQHCADKTESLAELVQLLDKIILADLSDSANHLMTRIAEAAALSHEITHLMDALPPLVRVLRYGSVRQIDQTMLGTVVDSLITRICLSLGISAAGINDERAQELLERLATVNSAITTLRQTEHSEAWRTALKALCDHSNSHGLAAGRACRLLLDARTFSSGDALIRLERALFLQPIAGKSVEELMQSAFWIEGFLKGSGLLVVHDEVLWALLDRWISEVREEHFLDVLPLLRRTFSSFSESIRQQLHDRLKQRSADHPFVKQSSYDPQQGQKVLPLIARLLGVQYEP